MFDNQEIAQATVMDVKKAIDTGEKITILDVRTEGEFLRTRIAGSINLPIQEIGEGIEQLIPNKNQKIYVYCLSGSRSVLAAEELRTKGYHNVANVENGLLAWRAKRYPTITTIKL